jgi:hypothetical protein
MIDSHPANQRIGADIRLRSILSSWYQSRGYRSVAAPRYRNLSVRFSSQTDLNREFKRQRRIGWTVGEICEATDATLLGLPDLGKGPVTHLRETLGPPSKDGVRPAGLKAKSK